VLILTKPLGTGIVTTGIKRGLTPPELERKVVANMARLNDAGPEVAERGWSKAAIDVTGFGLLGHLDAMCRASHVSAEINVRRVPVVGRQVFDLIAANCVPGGSRDNLAYANSYAGWDGVSEAEKILLADAQTSGGLLLSVPERRAEDVLKLLKKMRTPCAAVIGSIVRSRKPRIRVSA
jgi:selenide,water dikinase